MMPVVPQTRRIAFVSPHASAYAHRLVRGALSFAEGQAGLVIREFRVPRDLQPRADRNDPVKALAAWRPAGLLSFLEDEELDHCLSLWPVPPPVVSLCHVHDRPGVVKVCGSFSSLVKLAVDHFRQQGLRAIAMLSVVRRNPAQEPVFLSVVRPSPGYRPVFSEVVDAAVLDDPEGEPVPLSAALADWLGSLPKPAGVVCPDLGGGGYLIRVCHALGLRVPQDIAVIGSDDADVSLSCRPTLTSIVPIGERIGSEAAAVLTRMISGELPSERSVRFDAMDLRIRQSTGLQRAQVCDIAAAVAHITQHACRGLTVGQLLLATQRVSYKTFHSHFEEAIGHSPGRAILNRQLDEAKRLLVGSRLSVTMIAEKCGFGGGSDFARRFRSMVGVSPSEFRHRAVDTKVRTEDRTK